MATKKAKTVKAQIAVVYNDDGEYQAGGYRVGDYRYEDYQLIDNAYEKTGENVRRTHPCACVVDVELPIPKRIVGKVRRVKAVK